MFHRFHLGLRTQILLLGVTGVVVVGAIYLVGLRIEDNSALVAERFSSLESHTAKLSEGLLQGRETATQFLQKPNEKKVAAHEETIKSAIGHLLGAAGAVEAIYSILAINHGIMPPTLNLENPSEACQGVDLVPKVAKEKRVRAALSNSFGFGGTNASLVFKEFR